MSILDNLESAWDEEFSFESSKRHIEITSETCSDGCKCKSSDAHSQNK